MVHGVKPGDIPANRVNEAREAAEAATQAGKSKDEGASVSARPRRDDEASTRRAVVPVAAVPTSSWPTGAKVLAVLALVTICGAGLYQVRDWVAPVVLAFTLVLTVRPIHRWLIRNGVARWISAIITMFLILSIMVGIFAITSWSLVDVPDLAVRYADRFNQYTTDLFTWLEQNGFATGTLTDQVQNALNSSTVIAAAGQLATSVMNVGSFFAVMTFALFFITIDTLRVDNRVAVSNAFASNLTSSLAAFEGRVRQYWIVATLFGAVVSVIDYFILLFLGVPLAGTWAIFAFVTNYIPNVGFIIGVIPPALVGGLASGWSTAIWVIVLFTVVNVSIQGLLQPKIVGDAVGLSTTVTFVSLMFWTAVIGPVGSILAVPLTLFAKAVLVDSSPRTRWLDVFIAAEEHVEDRRKDGLYESEDPVPLPVSMHESGRRGKEGLMQRARQARLRRRQGQE